MLTNLGLVSVFFVTLFFWKGRCVIYSPIWESLTDVERRPALEIPWGGSHMEIENESIFGIDRLDKMINMASI